eukprot:maker-scaffold2199_size18937-snap-gene-0.2 protein:Tk00520 transcript:maker-scaffold2199_size18937-snap-gene-0.2-mRNA-1 annotation:"hypothetical protein THAOC_31358"
MSPMPMGLVFQLLAWVWCGVESIRIEVAPNPREPWAEGTQVTIAAYDSAQGWNVAIWYKDGQIQCIMAKSKPEKCPDHYGLHNGGGQTQFPRLVFDRFLAEHSGIYTMTTDTSSASSDPWTMATAQRSSVEMQIESESSEVIEVDVDREFTVACVARGGRPVPNQLVWLLDMEADFMQQPEYAASVSEVEVIQTDVNNWGYPDVRQTIQLTLSEPNKYCLECAAMQTGFEDARMYTAEITVLVRNSRPETRLAGGAIAAIILGSLVVLVGLGLLVGLMVGLMGRRGWKPAAAPPPPGVTVGYRVGQDFEGHSDISGQPSRPASSEEVRYQPKSAHGGALMASPSVPVSRHPSDGASWPGRPPPLHPRAPPRPCGPDRIDDGI